MKKLIIIALAAIAAVVPATAQATTYQWPSPSGVTMVAGTNSTSPSCARADAVIDQWLRSQPVSARPVNYNSATTGCSTRSSSAENAVMRVFCSNNTLYSSQAYYCQASGVWMGYVDWDRVSASKVTVTVKMWRG